MKKLLITLCFIAGLALAGNSWVTGNGSAVQYITNASVPAQNGAWAWGVCMDVVPALLVNSYSGAPQLAGFSYTETALPMYAQTLNSGGATTLAVGWPNETVGTPMTQIPIGGQTGLVCGWIAHDTVVAGGTPTDYANFFNGTGAQYWTTQQTYSALTTNLSTGWKSGGPYGADAINVTFQRICTGHAIIAAITKPPTRYGGCPAGTTLLNWDLGTTASGGTSMPDTSGNSYNGTSTPSDGTITVATSLYQTVVPVLKTYNSPAWTYTVSLRAGNLGQLDCSGSYSQAPTTNAAICFWQILAGVATVPPFNHSASQPQILLPTFGAYTVQLTVSDSAGNVAVETTEIDSVATDSNGIVVNANPIADTLLGPMIAYGKNGWQSNDSLMKYAVDAQYTYLGCCTAPTWATPLTGTVTYVFNNEGATTTTGSMTSTQLFVPTTDVSKIDVHSFPTLVSVNDFTTNNQEVILVTSCSSSPPTPSSCPGSGATNLIVGYNGRGIYNSNAIPYGGAANLATSHSSGAYVNQFRVNGSLTAFTTDSVQAMCPPAASSSLLSPTGLPIYGSATGLAGAGSTVTMTPGSTTMTGSGVTWNNANGIFTNNLQTVFVKGTHASGTPFSFNSWIATGGLVNSSTITLGTPYPADADSGSFSYYILNPIYPVLEYTRADFSTGRTYQNGIQACLGDLQMGGVSAHDYSTLNSTLMSSQNYSYQTSIAPSPSSAYQPAFYCTSCMAMAFYLRSGYQKAYTLAHWIEQYLSPSPGFDGGYTGAYWYTQNGAPLGGYLNLTVDPNTALTAANLRGYGVNAAALLPTEGCTDDARDDGVKRTALALGALYDPSYSSVPTYGTWLSALEAVYTGHDVGGSACKRTDNSFSTTMLAGTPVLTGMTLTNGSTAATGTGFSAPQCSTVANGTITIAGENTSVAVVSHSGTGFSGATGAGLRILIQQNGGAYYTAFSFVYVDATHLTLNGYWPGTDCTSGSPCSYTIDSSVPTNFGTSLDDIIDLAQTYSCSVVDSTHMTIFPAWSGTTGSSYNLYNGGANGSNNGSYSAGGAYEIQPFMLGGFTQMSITYAAAADSSHPWATLGNNVSAFMWSTPSYDANNYGIQYFANCGGCDQKLPYNSGTGYVYGGNDWAQLDATPNGGINVARGLAVEPLNSLTVAYKAGNITQSFGDHVYGAQWSNTSYAPNSAGFFTPGDNLSASNCVPGPGSLGTSKWAGFCGGIGMSYQWPAARLGGVLPAVNRTILIGVCLGGGCSGSVPNATNVDVVLTAPNSATPLAPVNCAASPCSVTADARIGNYLYVLKYKSAGGAVLAQSDPTVLTVQ
jgi:hypothetical protein